MSTEQHQQELGLRENGPVKRVEDYTFAPIRGFPMLQWAGKRPFNSTRYYPAQHKETYGPEIDGWRNKIYWGDNLQVMSHLLKEYRSKVKLVYIDPPFDSKADYKKRIMLKSRDVSNDFSVFEEKQYSDIWTNDEYLQFMYDRLMLIKELLANDGTIYLHCDTHKIHHIRCIMDEIFGPDNFINQIIWKRSHSHNDTKQGSLHYGQVHDIILFYSKSNGYEFNQPHIPYEKEYTDTYYKYIEPETGRRYWLDNLQGPGGAAKGNPQYEVMGVTRYWRYSRERMQKLIQEGRIVQTSPGTVPKYKRYLDEMLGRPIQDVWDDIRSLGGLGSSVGERLDYPTQKPETLLERIIKASSNEGDIVFDCFMGSGTTQSVAMKLGRRFIGADINLGALQITTKRLLDDAAEIAVQSQKLMPEDGQPTTFYTGFDVYNVNNYDIFRNPVQAKELLIQALEVNPLQAGSLFDGEKDGRMVKIMPINRIATRQDLNELITGLDYRAFEKRQAEHPNQAVEKISLVCMGHEPDLAAQLQSEVRPYKLDVEVVDILRDKQDLQFKRDAEAKIVIQDSTLVIDKFYPMNLLAKLSLQQEYIEDWRELVDSIMIDWNYDGAVLQPAVIDVPSEGKLVVGHYSIPDDAGTIRVKITDLLSESLETELMHG